MRVKCRNYLKCRNSVEFRCLFSFPIIITTKLLINVGGKFFAILVIKSSKSDDSIDNIQKYISFKFTFGFSVNFFKFSICILDTFPLFQYQINTRIEIIKAQDNEMALPASYDYI